MFSHSWRRCKRGPSRAAAHGAQLVDMIKRSKWDEIMSKTMVQIRNVPSEFHRRLKARAVMEGMSMSDYILREVGKALDRPTLNEVLERLRARPLLALR